MIINSNVSVIMTKKRNCPDNAKPEAASTQTSGMYTQATQPIEKWKQKMKTMIMTNDAMCHSLFTPRPQKNKDNAIASIPFMRIVRLPNLLIQITGRQENTAFARPIM